MGVDGEMIQVHQMFYATKDEEPTALSGTDNKMERNTSTIMPIASEFTGASVGDGESILINDVIDKEDSIAVAEGLQREDSNASMKNRGHRKNTLLYAMVAGAVILLGGAIYATKKQK